MSLGTRLLIMLYGLGIVLIGAYPIVQEYGSVFTFLKKKVVSYSQQTESQARSRAKLADPVSAAAGGSAAAERSASSEQSKGKVKDLDHLTKKDKTALNGLIQGLQP